MNRTNGGLGGRPPKHFSYADREKKLQAKARARGTTLLPLVIDLWEGILRGRIRVSADVRERVAARVAAKFGLPDRRELDMTVDLQSKLFELGGYKAAQGAFTAVPVDEEGSGATVDADLSDGSEPSDDVFEG